MEEKGRFSLDLAAKTLDLFNKEYGIPYPLPKMDMVWLFSPIDLKIGCYS
jgi:aminopeptidase 2